MEVQDPVSYSIINSVPGLGFILSLTILYEIDDIHRFSDVGKFISYCRLVKCSHNIQHFYECIRIFTRILVSLHFIQRTYYTTGSAIQDMSINHCCSHIAVTNQFLDCPYIVSVFQQVSCKIMNKGVAACVFITEVDVKIWINSCDFLGKGLSFDIVRFY